MSRQNPGDSFITRFAQRHLRVTDDFGGGSFTIVRSGTRLFTKLALVLHRDRSYGRDLCRRFDSRRAGGDAAALRCVYLEYFRHPRTARPCTLLLPA